jgi:hypothetical protein
VTGTCGAGGSIKPGAEAPGSKCKRIGSSPRSGRQRCRPLRGLERYWLQLSWGLRPRLYAFVRFADFGFTPLTSVIPYLCSNETALCSKEPAMQVRVKHVDWNLRSRWQNKAWGASPRIKMQEIGSSPRSGRQRCRPLRGLGA